MRYRAVLVGVEGKKNFQAYGHTANFDTWIDGVTSKLSVEELKTAKIVIFEVKESVLKEVTLGR